MDSRQHWEQSGLACSFEEYLEDALKERTLANQNLHKHIAELKAQVAAQAEVLQAASDHLDFCGYGDSWERQCAKEEGLEGKIAAALMQESE